MNHTMHTISPATLPQHAPLAGLSLTPDNVLLDHLHHSVLQMVSLVLERARRGDPSLAPWMPQAVVAEPPRVRPEYTVSAALASLSVREREVLQHIAAGDSNKLIARALDLSPHTVKRHVANILDKLGAQSRGQAAACWRAQR